MKPKYLLYDASFEKTLKKYLKRINEAQRQNFKKKFEIFQENIFDSRLKTHKLKGNLSNYYSFSISYYERIVFKILEDGGIYLIEIGDHDVCY